MKISFRLFITYSQLAVFRPELQHPFNDWSSEHVAQGFAWRDGSVSFRTLEDSEEYRIDVCRETEIHMKEGALRAILVPFTIMEPGQCEIASLSDGKIIDIEAANYAIFYQTGYFDNDRVWIQLSFIQMEHVAPQIILADEELSPAEPLLMEAFPA